jgi:hypothetical protein
MSFITIKCAIKSRQFGKFLSINSKGMNAATSGGAGLVTCSATLGVNETLYLQKFPNGCCAISAPNSPGVYLRLAGGDIAAGQKSVPGGSGTANCQYWSTVHPMMPGAEVFSLRTQADFSVAIESELYRGVFVRMNGDEGVVNAQWGVGSFERFDILLLD